MSVRNKINEVRDQLEKLNYRLTPQREAVLIHFISNEDQLFSAEEVYMATRLQQSDIGLATIYRTLELFEKLGILHKLDYGDGQSRYEFTKQAGHYHHHLICLGCGQVLHYDEDLLENVEARISRDMRFRIVDHSLRIFGYCEMCNAELSPED